MTSLKRNAANEIPVEPTETGLTSVPVESTAVVAAGTSASADSYVADGDIVIPSLRLVHPLSPLAGDFEEGSIVLNKESMLSDGDTPIKLTILSKKRYYRERTEFGGTVKPRLFYSESELKAAGGTTEWLNDVAPSFEDVLDCVVAIELDKEDPNAPFSFNDKHYAVALWSMHGGAFRSAGRLVQTAAAWSLKAGLVTGSWTLATKVEKKGKGKVITPILKAGPKNSPEVVEFLKSLVGQ